MQPKVIGVITLAEERQLHMKNEHDGSLTTGVNMPYVLSLDLSKTAPDSLGLCRCEGKARRCSQVHAFQQVGSAVRKLKKNQEASPVPYGNCWPSRPNTSDLLLFVRHLISRPNVSLDSPSPPAGGPSLTLPSHCS
ncbi:hypothetical protein E2C01_000367 [Portunus trituberculatus]|uniref:Uncharacterized protein n=1 Tax=Portunus trituberculatus TaxID=210409 RepID=A0A5B7CF14_PORTR|nr:hypothetical protein [Portunus trituberculatus]